MQKSLWAVIVLWSLIGRGTWADGPSVLEHATRSPLCGANCLYALHILAGDKTERIADIAVECGFDWHRGICFLNMKQYLIKHGFQIRVEKIAGHELANGRYYLIPLRTTAQSEYDHYILIIRRNAGEILYYNGNGKMERTTLDELQRRWSGEAIIVIGRVGETSAVSDK